MIIVFNKIIPFKGYKAITLWPFLFIRKGCKVSDVLINHEMIHGRQQIEMLLVLFYLWYGIEYLCRVIQYKGFHDGYKNISLEREASSNEENNEYLQKRKLFAWFKYL